MRHLFRRVPCAAAVAVLFLATAVAGPGGTQIYAFAETEATGIYSPDGAFLNAGVFLKGTSQLVATGVRDNTVTHPDWRFTYSAPLPKGTDLTFVLVVSLGEYYYITSMDGRF